LNPKKNGVANEIHPILFYEKNIFTSRLRRALLLRRLNGDLTILKDQFPNQMVKVEKGVSIHNV
jgi:hypothetical protein